MMIIIKNNGRFSSEIMSSGRTNSYGYNADPSHPGTSDSHQRPNMSFFNKKSRSKQKNFKSVAPLVGKGTGKTDSLVAAKHVIKVNRDQRKKKGEKGNQEILFQGFASFSLIHI